METLRNPDGEAVYASRSAAKALLEKGFELVSAPAGEDAEEIEEAGEEQAAVPAKSATRDVWDDYAISIGIDPSEHKTKGDLIEAVEAH
jgi:hypothetical protein